MDEKEEFLEGLWSFPAHLSHPTSHQQQQRYPEMTGTTINPSLISPPLMAPTGSRLSSSISTPNLYEVASGADGMIPSSGNSSGSLSGNVTPNGSQQSWPDMAIKALRGIAANNRRLGQEGVRPSEILAWIVENYAIDPALKRNKLNLLNGLYKCIAREYVTKLPNGCYILADVGRAQDWPKRGRRRGSKSKKPSVTFMPRRRNSFPGVVDSSASASIDGYDFDPSAGNIIGSFEDLAGFAKFRHPEVDIDEFDEDFEDDCDSPLSAHSTSSQEDDMQQRMFDDRIRRHRLWQFPQQQPIQEQEDDGRDGSGNDTTTNDGETIAANEATDPETTLSPRAKGRQLHYQQQQQQQQRRSHRQRSPLELQLPPHFSARVHHRRHTAESVPTSLPTSASMPAALAAAAVAAASSGVPSVSVEYMQVRPPLLQADQLQLSQQQQQQLQLQQQQQQPQLPLQILPQLYKPSSRPPRSRSHPTSLNSALYSPRFQQQPDNLWRSYQTMNIQDMPSSSNASCTSSVGESLSRSSTNTELDENESDLALISPSGQNQMNSSRSGAQWGGGGGGYDLSAGSRLTYEDVPDAQQQQRQHRSTVVSPDEILAATTSAGYSYAPPTTTTAEMAAAAAAAAFASLRNTNNNMDNGNGPTQESYPPSAFQTGGGGGGGHFPPTYLSPVHEDSWDTGDETQPPQKRYISPSMFLSSDAEMATLPLQHYSAMAVDDSDLSTQKMLETELRVVLGRQLRLFSPRFTEFLQYLFDHCAPIVGQIANVVFELDPSMLSQCFPIQLFLFDSDTNRVMMGRIPTRIFEDVSYLISDSEMSSFRTQPVDIVTVATEEVATWISRLWTEAGGFRHFDCPVTVVTKDGSKFFDILLPDLQT